MFIIIMTILLGLQVCRLAYEIMNHKHTDASGMFHSLDDMYYFGGQEEHKMKAIWPHNPHRRSEISLKVGDVIGIAGRFQYFTILLHQKWYDLSKNVHM